MADHGSDLNRVIMKFRDSLTLTLSAKSERDSMPIQSESDSMSLMTSQFQSLVLLISLSEIVNMALALKVLTARNSIRKYLQ